MGVTLYLIRHAQADARGPRYPDDSLRPLVAKGHKQAKALAKALEVLDIKFDRVFSSPYTRALETAEPLTGRLEAGEVKHLSELTSSDYPQLLTQVVDNLVDKFVNKSVNKQAGEPVDKGVDNVASRVLSDLRVAFVGHEPYLSDLTSYLLTGNINKAKLKFKKAMVVQLRGELEAGEMTLQMMLPARAYKKFQS